MQVNNIKSSQSAVININDGLDAFRKDPESMVQKWRTMLFEDIKSGKSFNEYRVLRMLRSLPAAQRDEIAEYIRKEHVFLFKFSDNTRAIAEHKDFSNIIKVNGPYKNLPGNITALLFGMQEKVNTKLSSQQVVYQLVEPPKNVSDLIKNIKNMNANDAMNIEGAPSTYKSNGYTITVRARGIKEIDAGLKSRIQEAVKIIAQLNDLIPQRPVTQVALDSELSTIFIADDYSNMPGGLDVALDRTLRFQKIRINLNDLINIDPQLYARHEMGHAVHTNSNHLKNRVWDNIYRFSLGVKKHDMFDESTYYKNGGHPADEASELFASSFNLFQCCPDELAAKINDPGNTPEARKLGIMIWCYMRDIVFKGRVFSKSDPFTGYSI